MTDPAGFEAVHFEPRCEASPPARARTRRPPLLLLIPAGAASLLAVLPIAYLIDRAGSLGWLRAWEALAQLRTLELVIRSVTLAAIVAALATAIGVISAWLVFRTDVPGRRLWQVLVVLPLAVPSYAAAYAWLSWRPSIAPLTGSVLALTLVSSPFVFLPVSAALRHLDPAHEEVARSLGYGTVRTALLLTLRQIQPAIAGGALLVALYVLSDFGAVATFRYEVFTFVVYGAYNAGFDPTLAAVLALALVGLATLFVFLEAKVRGSGSFARIGTGAARMAPPVHLDAGASAAALSFLGLVVALGIAFPMWRFVYWTRRAVEMAIPFDGVTTALWNSTQLSLLAAIATTTLAIPVAVLVARYRSRSTALVERSAYAAHALPGIVIAIALVYVGVRILRPIYQDVPLLIIAYVVLFLPLAIGAIRSGVEQTERRHEEIAASLGKPPRLVLARVTLPRAAPAIAAGSALVFVTTMKELPATLLLHPTGMDTLATRLWSYTAETNYAAGAPFVMGIVMFSAIPTALLTRLLINRGIGSNGVVGS